MKSSEIIVKIHGKVFTLLSPDQTKYRIACIVLPFEREETLKVKYGNIIGGKVFSDIPKSFLWKIKGFRRLLKSSERIVNVYEKVFTLLSPDQTKYKIACIVPPFESEETLLVKYGNIIGGKL